jgi:Peptidase family M28/PDZ domain/PA domain
MRKIKIWLALPIALLLLAATPATLSVGAADSARFLDDIKALTVPAMEGRGDGTKGLALATHFIEQRFKSLGIEPAGSQAYLQPFSVVTGAKILPPIDVIISSPDAGMDLSANADFVPFSFSASGKIDDGLVFAGYGVTAEEFGYDDYAGVDVKGKTVIILRDEPPGFGAKTGNQGMTRHAQLITKAINARDHGASAVILVNGKLAPGEDDLLTRFGSVSGPENAGIVVLQMKNDAADACIKGFGKSLADSQAQIDGSSKPASFAFPATIKVHLNVHIETTRATVDNVLAYLPGKTDEYIIVGAHYDHLGYGYYGSLAPSLIGQIHPGADDNASGTAGVLELARLFAPLKGQLPRGILFMSFAGEELGLLGSADWVKEPTRPLDKADAMINMDMIGRIKDGKVFIGGVGTGSTFKDVLAAAEGLPDAGGAHEKSGLKIEYSSSGYGASDHTSFVTKHIPSLFIFSGLHSDYHKPSDTWEKINSPSAAELLDLIGKVILQLDESDARPAFQVVAEAHPGATSGGGGGYGPYFGSIPDFGEVKDGVRFADVKPGSPAAKAGLLGGDIMIQFGEKPIHNLYDFTDALRSSKIGDVVEVTVLRDGKPLKASVTLEQRK